MGKATHTHVSRLLCLADLDDVQERGCMNNAQGVEPMRAQEWLDELERLDKKLGL